MQKITGVPASSSVTATMLHTWLSLKTEAFVAHVPATGSYSCGFIRSEPATSELRPPIT